MSLCYLQNILWPAIAGHSPSSDLFLVYLFIFFITDAQIKEWGLKFMIPCAFAISLFLAVVFQLFLSPYLQKRVEVEVEQLTATEKTKEEKEGDATKEQPRLEGIDEHAEIAEVAEVGVEMAKPVEDDEEHAEYSSGLSSKEEKVEEEEEEKALTASERLKSSVHSSIRTFGEATINRDIEAQVSVECFVKFDT